MILTLQAHPRLAPSTKPFQEPAVFWVIDRFEGSMAVVENRRRETRDVPRDLLPAESKPGDVLREKPEGWTLDPAETRRRQGKIDDMTKDLWA